MKLVWRTIPIDLLDWSAIEGWLEHMAQKGYQPKKTFGMRVGFEKAGYSHTRCRLVPVVRAEDDPEPEFLEFCQGAGWQHVDHLYSTYHLYITHDPEAPELFTDPVTEEWILSRLDKYNRNGWIFIGISVLLAAAIFLYSSFKNALTGWNLLLGNVLLLILILCIQLFLYPSIRRRKRKHRAQLRAGISVEHGLGWETARKAYWVDILVRVLGWVLIVVIPLRPSTNFDLAESPVLFSLHSIETSTRSEGGYFTRRSTLFAPVQIETYQYLGDSSLRMEYFDLAFEAMAVPLARDMMTHYDEEVFPALYETAQVPENHGFDFLAAARRADEGGWLLTAALDGKVAYIRYSGPANLLDSLGELRDALD